MNPKIILRYTIREAVGIVLMGVALFWSAGRIDCWPAWALIVGGLNAILLILRTALEDRALQAELSGYDDYGCQVRHRLLPGVW